MKKIFSFFLQSLMLVALALTGASCERVIYDGEVDCPPGYVKISVKSSPAGGGDSQVQEDAHTANAQHTDGEHYVHIIVVENGTYTLSATPATDEDYVFVGWHDDTNDKYVGNEEKPWETPVIAGIVAAESTQYTAVFAKRDEVEIPVEPQPVRISVMSQPAGGGVSKVFENDDNTIETEEDMYVSIDVLENNTYTLTATANDGYIFKGWYDETNHKYIGIDDEDSDGQPMSVIERIATAPAQYIALFEKIEEPQPVRISVKSSPAGSGFSMVQEDADPVNAQKTDDDLYVSIDVLENTTYSLIAEAKEGYVFVGWYDELEEKYLEPGVAGFPNLVATAPKQYTAVFELLPVVEPEPEVSYYVEFVYEMNMKYADAFRNDVKAVELYVFQNGQFVKHYTATTTDKFERGYRMDVSDLTPGEYEFITWCHGKVSNPDFKLPDDKDIKKPADLNCILQTTNKTSNANLTALFHARNEKVVLEEKPEGYEQTVLVELTKNTNNINLSLTQLGNAKMEPGQFDVQMVDGPVGNGIMGYDNAVSGAEVIYIPWYGPVYGTESFVGNSTSNEINYMHTEISTARLMADHNPTIVIRDTKNNDEIVFSIPIVKWALAFRSQNYGSMKDQEYLDREDEYNVVLYLEKNDKGWTAVQVVINDWRVVDNGTANF